MMMQNALQVTTTSHKRLKLPIANMLQFNLSAFVKEA